MEKLKPVLYAEDDENDVFMMERTFRKLGIAHPLQIASDGKMAVAYLSGAKPYEGREDPCLLMLDLSMPGRHGLDILKWLRSKPELAALPAIVLTSSNQQTDIRNAYQLGAKGYIVKPGNPNELVRAMKRIQEYWLADSRPAGEFVEYAAEVNVPPPRPAAEGAAGDPVVI